MSKCKPTHSDGPSRPRLVDVLANDCCHPSCNAPACDTIATQVPLCETHIYDVYKATNRMLRIQHQAREEYALLPMEQNQIPGPCPACGLTGYLASIITGKVRCLNASCNYEAYVDQFEVLRRNILFDIAADQNVVYYIKFRDLVKIGTSHNLRQRWQTLQAVESLYGFEYGTYSLERYRHCQFSMYRMNGEWFEDNRHIRAHINKVCVSAAA